MRTLLFRGKRIDNSKWIYGDIHFNIDQSKAHIHERGHRTISHNVVISTVSQSIGYEDEDGQQIFEDDVIEYNYSEQEKRKMIIIFDAFHYYQFRGVTFSNKLNKHDPLQLSIPEMLRYCGKIKIIGTIHDKELIK